MIDPIRFYIDVRDTVEREPSLAIHALQAVTDGLIRSAEEARRDRAEWESIAMIALEGRLFSGAKKPALADRIADLSGRAGFNWHSIINKLRGTK